MKACLFGLVKIFPTDGTGTPGAAAERHTILPGLGYDVIDANLNAVA